jgi:opacity protein-like surface antigen
MRKKIFALGIAVLFCTAVIAQDATTPVPEIGQYTNTGGLYIKGGLNLANVSTSSDGSVNSAKTRASFNVGFAGDIPLTNFLSLQAGALFTGKGSRAQYNSSLYSGTYTFRPYYVEVPVNAVFKLPLAQNAAILLGAGVYGAMGVAGDFETDEVSGVGSGTSSQKIKWTNSGDITTGPENGSGAGVLRRYDFGMNYLAGVELGPVEITANYGMGLTKISSTADNNNDNDKNRVWSIDLGFRL